MPAIRDTSWNYETLTTDGGVVVPAPNNETGDLLIGFIMGDTGAPTWTLPAGWTQLFATNNTVSTLCAYKISNGAEPSSLTFTASVLETYNGAVISIRDVDQTNPFGSPSVFNSTTQAALAKFNMQSITTNRADSLCLVFSANSGLGVPSFIEGIAHSLVAADGSAESMGLGWFFQKAAGATPSNISCSNVGTGIGVKAVVQICPPLAGAAIIPTYIAQDNCTYLDPISGVTAYNANTALAATADTGYGTSLGGVTAADATVSALTDTGINSFHSTGQIASVASATNTYGAELVFAVANRPNATGKNILAHMQCSTAGQLQRFTNIKSGKGAWMGIRSGAASNYKIWQVLGVDSPNAQSRYIPVIINESALNTKASNGTLAPATVLSVGFWVAGTVAGTTVWQLASLWLMDTTVVCGGNAAEPIEIPAIVKAIADSHERKSAILQGADQMLLLQDLQIGNGGTNPIYLDLNATAIEFPSQFNAIKKQVSYNSVDNKIGILYYAGATDTVKHRNSVISSPSRYKWGLHAASSLSAVYDFSGLAVIGAGAITLDRAITITELTINDYVTLSVNDLDLISCTILNVPVGNDSITTNAGTIFSACSIDVSRVTAGNRWASVTSPSIYTNCNFTGGGGHAIRITTPGTYTFTGNQFTGFGATGSTGAAIFNDSGGAVTINITGGGSTPTYRNGTSATTTVNNAVSVQVTVKDAVSLTAIDSARVLIEADVGGALPAGASVTLMRIGTTVSVVHIAHGMSNGKQIVIRGANQDEYNGVYTIANASVNGYDYTIVGSPATPATGTITTTAIILSGLTNASGIITTSLSLTSNQPITGKVRRATTGTKYKTGAITGTINTSIGLDSTVLLISDE